jgi:D-methionine transport system ATP-binding protein
MIRLIEINKSFQTANGTLQALDSVSMHIKKGEIYGFIGFSGAGKSTLIRCVNLLEKPDNGRVIVDGEDLMTLSKRELLKRRQKIGMIFQNYNLLQNATVFNNVAFPLEISGTAKAERKERVIKCLDVVDLTEKAGDYPVKLSGGQKQRVAIARAIVTSPKILLCDEPTSALDPETTKTILLYLKRINKDLGITVVLVTHEMEAARSSCNTVSVMDKGRIVETLDLSDFNLFPQSKLAKYLFTGGTGI